ncbi:NACHT domain-containing protein [Providencia rettgeri]|uniref:NACHT domain-containing protein n=1 Tax=Providencia rettgeri TaxID=587 RepID=UPI0035269B89
MSLEGIIATGLAESSKIIGSVTAKFAVAKLFNKIKSVKWKYGSDEGRKLYNSLVSNDNSFLKYIEVCIEKNLFTYTLIDPENRISISESYYPIKIKKKKETSDADIIIDNNFYFTGDDITNISGVAGQGKSTILRKMLINQIEFGDKIPFFINLHSMKKESILEEIIHLINETDTTCTESSLKSLLLSGRVVIFLDGFDEVQNNKRDDLLKQIVDINENLKTQIITTSRPDTIICDTAGIKQYRVVDLEFEDVIGIIKRANVNLDVNSLELSLRKNKKFASSLKTPILVILLIKCFPYMKIIPNETTQFYEDIFNVMYETHDKIKKFRNRSRIEDTFDRESSYEFFCAFCFVTLLEEITSMDIHTMEAKAFEAMELIDASAKNNSKYKKIAKNIIFDIKDITSLIIKDAEDNYTFPHKSIQEYHAASFVKIRPSSNGEKEEYCSFVSEVMSNTTHIHNFLEFFKRIDPIDSINYVLKPYILSLGATPVNNTIEISNDDALKIINYWFKKTFIIFIPRGTKEIKHEDSFIKAAGKHSKKQGRAIIGPAHEVLGIVHAFFPEMESNYSEKIINEIAKSDYTLECLLKRNKVEKIPLNNFLDSAPTDLINTIIVLTKDKLRMIYYDYYLKLNISPIERKVSFIERFRSTRK